MGSIIGMNGVTQNKLFFFYNEFEIYFLPQLLYFKILSIKFALSAWENPINPMDQST